MKDDGNCLFHCLVEKNFSKQIAIIFNGYSIAHYYKVWVTKTNAVWIRDLHGKTF